MGTPAAHHTAVAVASTIAEGVRHRPRQSNILLTEDMSVGTFGHPWERTPRIFGELLVSTIVATSCALSTADPDVESRVGFAEGLS